MNGVSTRTAIGPATNDADNPNRLRRVETVTFEVFYERARHRDGLVETFSIGWFAKLKRHT